MGGLEARCKQELTARIMLHYELTTQLTTKLAQEETREEEEVKKKKKKKLPHHTRPKSRKRKKKKAKRAITSCNLLFGELCFVSTYIYWL